MDVPSPDEIINGVKPKAKMVMHGPDGQQIQLTDDQERALGVIMSGMAFVFIGIKPTESGADFFRALHGDETDLRNARPFLDEQISKAFRKREIV